MIPDFDSKGNLPCGVHWATWQEFVQRFGITPHRMSLLSGLRRAIDVFKAVGCETIYVDGSFVTSKVSPGDFDACWDTKGVDLYLLKRSDPVLLTFTKGRAAQKAKYLGEFFPADMTEGGSGETFLEFFQIDKETGDAKGIIALDLRGA